MRDKSPDLISAVDRLHREVINLRRDAERLYLRVDPEWDGREPGYLRPAETNPLHSLMFGKPKPVTEQQALERLQEIRDIARGALYDLSAIRGHMDDICKDAISRAEMKPYLKER